MSAMVEKCRWLERVDSCFNPECRTKVLPFIYKSGICPGCKKQIERVSNPKCSEAMRAVANEQAEEWERMKK